MGSDDTKTIRVEAGTKIGSFKPETVNNLVRITGKLVEQRIDEAYLTEWEAQVKAQTAEKHGTTEQGCASEQKARGEAKFPGETWKPETGAQGWRNFSGRLQIHATGTLRLRPKKDWLKKVGSIRFFNASCV